MIRNVTLNDAGLYTARDEIHALEASANLTVIGFCPFSFYVYSLLCIDNMFCIKTVTAAGGYYLQPVLCGSVDPSDCDMNKFACQLSFCQYAARDISPI